MDDDLIAFDDYWREMMKAAERIQGCGRQGDFSVFWLEAPKQPNCPRSSKNVRPAISGLLTEADGDHRVGRFK